MPDSEREQDGYKANTWLQYSWRGAWLALNVVAAFVAVWFFSPTAIESQVTRRLRVALLVVAWLFLVLLLITAVLRRWARPLVPWAVAAAVLALIVVGRMANDAGTLLHYNCWKVSGNPSREIVACAPGAKPKQGEWAVSDPQMAHPSNLRSGGRACVYLRTVNARVTLWRCRSW